MRPSESTPQRKVAERQLGLMGLLAEELEKLPSGTPEHVKRLQAELRRKRQAQR